MESHCRIKGERGKRSGVGGKARRTRGIKVARVAVFCRLGTEPMTAAGDAIDDDGDDDDDDALVPMQFYGESLWIGSVLSMFAWMT